MQEGMEKMKLALQIIYIIITIALIAVVLFQKGKDAGLSSAVSGAAETFYGKNKARTLDAIFEKWTAVFAILFVILSVVLFAID